MRDTDPLGGAERMRNHVNRTHADADQWGGIDGLGRELPTRAETGPRREGRYVGLFYFLWLGQHGTSGPFDNSEILAQYPEAVWDPAHPAWGPENAFHFWGEPLYGYYLNDDAWVLRRHVQLLTSAGVDFIVFDTTNAVTYKKVYDVLFRVLDEVWGQGFIVPQFAFYTNTDSGTTIADLYEDIYKPGRYKHLWFHWKGKPLIIGDPAECTEEQRAFFTFRRNQWPNEEAKVNGFPWIEFQRPQRVFFNDEEEKEVISVSVAQHPSVAMSDTPFYGYGNNWGRGYHEGMGEPEADLPESIHRGMNIAEQWEFAIAEDPQIIFVTGWNEWIAMRLQGTPDRPVLFVDQATLAFSRDIEPMKGGYQDHYYMQLIGDIRRYKGMSEPVDSGTFLAAEPDFTTWPSVPELYRDFEGDTMRRDHAGYGSFHYFQDTGRNDLVTLKAAHTDHCLYFYTKTKDPITPYTDPHWMMLLIRNRRLHSPGWEGYHYIVNRTVIDRSKTLLEHSIGEWNWKASAEIRYFVSGNEMYVEIPLALLRGDEAPKDRAKGIWIEFKWIDNMQNDGDIADFYLHGDTAPEGRLNFVYRSVDES